MMQRMAKLLRDKSGAAAIEFVVAVPVLVVMIWGMFQISLLFEANAGVQHALGEAARYATIYPTPSDTNIKATITAKKFGVGNGTWSEPVINNANLADGYKVITVKYAQPTDFLLFNGPSVTITKSKTVYLSV